MKTMIISSNRNRSPMPVVPYGACVTAEAVRRRGHQAQLVDLMFQRNPARSVIRELRRHRPHVVGISVRNLDNNDMFQPAEYVSELVDLVAVIREETEAPVVLGGSAVAVMPEALLRVTGANCAVLGDGEFVYPLVMEALINGDGSGTIPRVAWVDDGKYRVKENHPLALQPCPEFISPDYHRWIDVRAYGSRMATIPLQSKRGCPFPCVYCTYGVSEGLDYRLYQPEDVAEAISRLATKGLRDIEFVDNVFNSPYEHAMEVCHQIALKNDRVRLQTVEINPQFLDRNLLEAMKDAGFIGMGITAESAADPVLHGLAKGYNAGHVHSAAEAVHATDLPCLWLFLLGGPGETKETVLETVDFATGVMRPGDAAFFNVGIRIYPGTELEKIARRENVLKVTPDDMIDPTFYFSPDLDPMWTLDLLHRTARKHRSILYSALSLNHPFMPLINRVASSIGLSRPLWRHTGTIRGLLRLIGRDI